MENATDALKIAAAVLVFVGALSLTMIAFTKSREASSTVMSAEEGVKTYYELNKNYSSYREVGVDSIIPMMYSYYNNFYTILFYIGEDWDEVNDTFSKITPLPLYYTEALDTTTTRRGTTSTGAGDTQLQKSTVAVKSGSSSTNTRAIYGLDINDELTRQEPWAYNERNDKLFIDALVNGKEWIMPNWSRTIALGNGNKITTDATTNIHNLVMMENYKYFNSFNGFEAKPFATNSNAKFIERVGLYNYEAIYANNDSDAEGVGAMSGGSAASRGQASEFQEADQTQSTTTFVDENGDEVGTIANENATQKKIIQYIYIKSRK